MSNYLKMMCRYVQIPCAKNPLSSCVKKTNSGSKIQDPMNYFSQFPGVRTLTSFCFAVNGRVQEAKADGRSLCYVFLILLLTPHCAVSASMFMWKDVMGVP